MKKQKTINSIGVPIMKLNKKHHKWIIDILQQLEIAGLVEKVVEE